MDVVIDEWLNEGTVRKVSKRGNISMIGAEAVLEHIASRFPLPVKELVLQFKSIEERKVILKITAGTDTFLPSDVHISIFLSATDAQPVIVLKESVFIDVKKRKGEANGVRTHWRMLCAGLAFIASQSGRPEFAALEYVVNPPVEEAEPDPETDEEIRSYVLPAVRIILNSSRLTAKTVDSHRYVSFFEVRRSILRILLASLPVEKADEALLDVVESFYIVTKRSCRYNRTEYDFSKANIRLARPTFVYFNRRVSVLGSFYTPELDADFLNQLAKGRIGALAGPGQDFLQPLTPEEVRAHRTQALSQLGIRRMISPVGHDFRVDLVTNASVIGELYQHAGYSGSPLPRAIQLHVPADWVVANALENVHVRLCLREGFQPETSQLWILEDSADARPLARLDISTFSDAYVHSDGLTSTMQWVRACRAHETLVRAVNVLIK